MIETVSELKTVPEWAQSLLLDQLALGFADESGTVTEIFGEASNWMNPGDNLFADVPMFVGLADAFEEARKPPNDDICIDGFRLAGSDDDRRYSLRVVWVNDPGRYCISITEQGWAGGVQDQALQESRKEAYLQACLENERIRYGQIYRATPALMVAFAVDGSVKAISDQFRELVVGAGANGDEALAARFANLVDHRLWFDAWQGINLRDVPFTLESADHGRRELELSSFKVAATAEEAEQCYFVAADVTQRNKLKRQLEIESENLAALNNELEHRNNELERFASAASHDLQAPLTRMAVYTDMLEAAMRQSNADEAAENLEVIRTSARRSRKLVEDMLRLARLSNESLTVYPINLESLVADILDDLEAEIGQAEATVVPKFNLREFPSDRELVRQILTNLISNAVKYSADGRRPIVRVTIDGKPSEYLELVVSDNGIGFRQDQVERMFLPFVRLTDGSLRHSGSGVGLAIVRKAIDRLKGSIEAASDYGNGSRFSVHLPAL